MKKSLFIFFSLLTGVILLANFGFQKPEIHKPMSTFPPNDHAKEWAAIDSLEKRGLPREALERANQLYQVVRKENNPSQIIKCLIYRGKFNSELEEDGLVKAIAAMQTDLNYTTFPVKPVLQSMLAEMYARYLDNNHWKFSDRTETVDFKTDDIRTWTPGQILEKSADLYLQSVAEDRTKQVNIEDFAAILSTGNDQIVRPTLFDFLAFRALDYFMNERSYLTEPVYKFYLDNEAAFAPAAGFSKEIFASRDSSSYKLQTLRLFQKLIAFHLNDANPAALVDADLKRLQFVYDQAVIDIKDELYEKALRDLMKRHEAHEVFSNISHQLAAYYFNRGNNYQPRPFYFQNIENQEVEKNKWDFKTAFEICQTAIDKYPNSLGSGNCKNLQGQILQKNIQLYVEEVNLPEEPCLAKLEYKNLKKIFIKVIKLDEETRQKIDRIEWDERVAFFNQLQVSETWALDLPDDGDYRMHSIELKIPALKFGQYLIMASDNAEFSEKQGGINYVFTQVSGIAFLQNNYSKTGTQYIVVNRKSGTPLKDVEAEFFKIEYNQLNKQGEPKKIGSAKSNAEGKILPNIAERGSFKVKFSKGKDVLLPDSWHANYTQTATRYARINTHFFLDRAIYRPGQTIYFKGLVIEYDSDGMPSVVPKMPVTIMLRDANFQKVAELNLTTNEYGTVNGTFTAPTSGLLGAMQLTPTTTGIDGAASFRVEEYKRPKFEVTFNPVEGSYKLGEKVKVKGSAKAYAGSNIDGADVSYRVVRRVNFPFWKWWYWGGWNPWQGAEMEIGNGRIKTDENGNFEIEFEAQPDRSIPAERKPEFNYVVLADVTDITGETQSGQTSVRVGYAALELDFQLPETIEAYELDSLKIGAYNLSGQDESAFVNVTITPLKAPSKIFVNRLWAMPDRVIFDKNTFEKDFPHFAFGNEDQKEAWVKESPVLSKTFPCKGATKLYVANIVWRPGVYLIAVKSKDKFGTAVELERFVSQK